MSDPLAEQIEALKKKIVELDHQDKLTKAFVATRSAFGKHLTVCKQCWVDENPCSVGQPLFDAMEEAFKLIEPFILEFELKSGFIEDAGAS